MTPTNARMNRPFPWYDAAWLNKYLAAKNLFARVQPARLSEFVRALEPFRTRPDFTVKEVDHVFDEATMTTIKETIRTLRLDKLETHETRNFGRFVVHSQPYFTELQRTLIPLVSELAGEQVEPHYNFLSLYSKFGVCPVHMDAPDAKWTLDICVEQTEPWPIHFSQIVPWPEDFDYHGEDWQEWVKRSPDLKFTAHTLQPGKALFFSGSSQWHYRNRLSPASGQGSCKLLFFHFVPKGTLELSQPKNWPQLFGTPELTEVVASPSPASSRVAAKH